MVQKRCFRLERPCRVFITEDSNMYIYINRYQLTQTCCTWRTDCYCFRTTGRSTNHRRCPRIRRSPVCSIRIPNKFWNASIERIYKNGKISKRSKTMRNLIDIRNKRFKYTFFFIFTQQLFLINHTRFVYIFVLT